MDRHRALDQLELQLTPREAGRRLGSRTADALLPTLEAVDRLRTEVVVSVDRLHMAARPAMEVRQVTVVEAFGEAQVVEVAEG